MLQARNRPKVGYMARDAAYLDRELQHLVRGYLESDPKPKSLYDFSKPTLQPRPLTAQRLSDRIGATPTHIWAGTTSDVVGSDDLDVELDGPLTGQKAYGLYNGIDLKSYPAVELLDTNDKLATTSLRPSLTATGKVAILMAFRCNTAPPSQLPICGAWDSTTDGFGVFLDSSGNLQARVGDGSTFVTTTAIAGPFTDGAWHVVLAVFDRDNDTVDVYTDLGDVLGFSSATVVGDSTATTGTFGLGRTPGVYSNGLPGQCAYLALFEGAEVDSLSGLGTYWNHAKNPTRAFTSYTHASLASFPVETDSSLGEIVSHFSGDGTNGQDQVVIREMPGGEGMGLANWSAQTNLIIWSEDFSVGKWVANGASVVTPNSFDSPDGFRNGTLLEGSAATDNISNPTLTVTAATVYTFSAWLRLKDASSGTIRLRYDDGTGGTIDEDVTATDRWVRYTHTFTTTSVNLIPRIYAGDGVSSQNDVYVWGAQVVAGGARGAYARTQGTSATVAGCSTRGQLNDIPGARGEIEAVWATDFITGNNQLVVDTPSTVNRHAIYVQSATNTIVWQLRSSAGAVVTLPTTAVTPLVNTKYITRVGWDVDAVLGDASPYNAACIRVEGGGVRDELYSGNSPYVATDVEIRIGSQFGNADSNTVEGAVQRVAIYDEAVFL